MLPDHDIAFTGDTWYKDDRTAVVRDRLRHHIVYTFVQRSMSIAILIPSTFQLHVVHHGRLKNDPDRAKITRLGRCSGDICTWDVVYDYTPVLSLFMLTYAQRW